jgi:hypothetical protein
MALEANEIADALEWAAERSKMEVQQPPMGDPLSSEEVLELSRLPEGLSEEFSTEGIFLQKHIGPGRMLYGPTHFFGYGDPRPLVIIDIPWIRTSAAYMGLEWPRWAAESPEGDIHNSDQAYKAYLAALGRFFLRGAEG